ATVHVGDWLRSSLIGQRGHHACRHVVKMMTVKGPPAGVGGVERNCYRAHRCHEHGVAHGACEASVVDRNYLKMMTVKMHRVGHHRLVAHQDLDPLASLDHGSGWAASLEHAPLVTLHIPGERNFDPAIGLARRERLSSAEPALEVKGQGSGFCGC